MLGNPKSPNREQEKVSLCLGSCYYNSLLNPCSQNPNPFLNVFAISILVALAEVSNESSFLKQSKISLFTSYTNTVIAHVCVQLQNMTEQRGAGDILHLLSLTGELEFISSHASRFIKIKLTSAIENGSKLLFFDKK